MDSSQRQDVEGQKQKKGEDGWSGPDVVFISILSLITAPRPTGNTLPASSVITNLVTLCWRGAASGVLEEVRKTAEPRGEEERPEQSRVAAKCRR